MPAIKYFYWSFLVTILGLVLAFYLGWTMTGTISGAMPFLLIGTVLAILEISLSFDNAIVNANTLQQMTEIWRKRFLTWGILIAVFGMRIVLPLVIVALAAHITPYAAIHLALNDPAEYSRLIDASHLSISAFGGTFLMMVALSYFIDQDKEIDWFQVLEIKLRKWSSIRGLEIIIVLCVVMAFTSVLPASQSATFLFASIAGLLTFLGVELLGNMLDVPEETQGAVTRGGLGAFLYLEVLDASFSFDGVVGAFALTTNLFLIAIGLGIGAMYVRSMTIMLVERGTLVQYRFLEHGAFYSILTISIIMFAQSLVHVPELVTGLVGAGLIGLALRSSLKFNRANS